jgi:para-nitrobenzyl esterase
VFDNLDAPGLEALIGPIGPDARALADVTAAAWIAMARTGQPGHGGLPEWPTYRADRRAVLELGPVRTVLENPGGAERQFWAERAS